MYGVALIMEKQDIQLNKDIKEIVEEIYQQIYCKFSEQYIVVFLCGGASNRKVKSLRDRVRVLLENEKKTLWYKPFKIFYPEDLLIEILNKTKDADLLSYEQKSKQPVSNSSVFKSKSIILAFIATLVKLPPANIEVSSPMASE